MIVETMTFEEIVKEYEKIHNSIYPVRVKDRIDYQGMRRYFIKNKNEENVWFKPLDFKIDRITTFCVIPYSRNWSDFQKIGPLCQVCLIYLTSKGYTLLVRGRVYDNEYAFYTSHLFDRYRERELQDLSLCKMDVIREFFKRNGNMCGLPFPTENNPNNSLEITEKGVLFGEKITDNIRLYKTYIRKDQLKEGQFASAMEAEEGMSTLIQWGEKLQDLVLNDAPRSKIIKMFYE